ncbi:MAG TPA: flagella assembly protein FlgT middle domain-containing protein, partial [Thermoanaerobaculia bacterium]|nr:flagella assembly protein FlgT middle domain-containing protein [Thermoanaerobaculia bacterium]
VIEVPLKLPLKPRLAIAEGETIALAPFIIAADDQETRSRSGRVDVQAEFARYLKKQISKSTKLEVVDATDRRLPTADWDELEANRDFWREVAQSTGAAFVLSGVIDFDIEDKSGYRTEEYVSPMDGRTYYRQVLVESTGFVFDIVVAVFDGDTGEKVIEENFRDFKEFDQRNYDEILGLFENLRALETQLVGIFVSQETSATRYMFTN